MTEPARNLQENVQEILREIRLDNLFLVADMTLTLLAQSDDGSGFSSQMRLLLSQLLDRRVTLLVCSGDSSFVIREQLLSRLAYSGESSIYVASGSGSEILVDEPATGGRSQRIMFSLEPLELRLRESLLNCALRALQHVVGRPIVLTAKERSVMLLSTGGRIDIGHHVPGLNETLYLELGTKGLSIFLRDTVRAIGLGLKLLVSLSEDSEFKQVCCAGQLDGVIGPNFFDARRSSKAMAIQCFLKTPPGNTCAAKRSLVIGDSMNDREMFQHFAGTDAVLAFVGAPEDFLEVTGGGPNAIYLGRNMVGTELLFSELLRLASS